MPEQGDKYGPIEFKPSKRSGKGKKRVTHKAEQTPFKYAMFTGWAFSELRIGSTGSTTTYDALSKTSHHINIMLNKIGQANREEADARDICDSYVPPHKLKWFQKYNVAHVPVSGKVHKHPFSRAAANTNLYRSVARSLHQPFAVFQMKRTKAQTLARVAGQPCTVYNYALTARDFSRFSQHGGLPAYIDHEVAVMDEVLQMLPLETLAGILNRYGTVNEWHFTANIPFEIGDRSESMHEEYALEYPPNSDSFIHILEGEQSDNYEQPLASFQYLKLRHFSVLGQVWTFERVNSVSSHHHFVARRGKHESPKWDVFNSVDLVRIPAFGKNLAVKWIPSPIYTQLYCHARALKSYTAPDPFAKMRTYVAACGVTLPNQVINHLAAVLLKVAELDVRQASAPVQFQSVSYRLKAWIRRKVHAICPFLALLIFGINQLLLDNPELYMPPVERFRVERCDMEALPALGPLGDIPSPPNPFHFDLHGNPPDHDLTAGSRSDESDAEDSGPIAPKTRASFLREHGKRAAAAPAPALMTNARGDTERTYNTSDRVHYKHAKEILPPSDESSEDEIKANARAARRKAKGKQPVRPKPTSSGSRQPDGDEAHDFQFTQPVQRPSGSSESAPPASQSDSEDDEGVENPSTGKQFMIATQKLFFPSVRQFIIGVKDNGTRRSLAQCAKRGTPGFCLIDALVKIVDRDRTSIWELATNVLNAEEVDMFFEPAGASILVAHKLATALGIALNIHYHQGKSETSYVQGNVHWVGKINDKDQGAVEKNIKFVKGAAGQNNHWSAYKLQPKNPFRGGRFQLTANEAPQVRAGALPPLPKNVILQSYQPDFAKAKRCYEAWIRGEVGVIFDNYTHQEREALAVLFKAPIKRGPILLAISVGAPGSGKSQTMKNYVKQNVKKLSENMHINFSRKFLLEEWKDIFFKADRERGKMMLKTLEKSPMWDIKALHIEELQQHPPGYIDMRAYLCPSLQWVTCTGAPEQNLWTAGRVQSSLDFQDNELHSHEAFWSEYNLDMHRCSQIIAHVTGLQTTSTYRGRIRKVYGPLPDLPTVQARTKMADFDTKMDRKSVTMQSCTGYTFKTDYQVIIDHAAVNEVSAENIFTAITRGEKDLILVIVHNDKRAVDDHPLWGPIMRGETITWDRFVKPPSRVTSKLVNVHLRAGRAYRTSKQIRERNKKSTQAPTEDPLSKFDNLPAEYHALWEPECTVIAPEAKAQEPEPREPELRTHLPSTTSLLGERFFEPLRSKESMEFQWGHVSSNQIRDLKGDGVINHLFCKQDSRDETLLPATVQKRMRFRSAAENEKHLRSTEQTGALLFSNFVEKLRLGHDQKELEEDLVIEAKKAVLERKLQKSTGTLVNNVERTSPDIPENSSKIFTKSQEKAKRTTVMTATTDEADPNWFEPGILPQVKAGQTLALFQDQVLEKLGWVTRYIDLWMRRHLPSHVKIFGGMTQAELERWCKEHAKSGINRTNDFTAYDQSCVGETLNFELDLMAWLGFDPEVIAYYRWIKINTRTNFGHSAIARFTGEPGTYIFNSLFNIAYTLLQYVIPWLMACIFSGDDSLIFGLPELNPLWHILKELFTLVAKTYDSDLPEFCGWLLYPQGIIRDPLVLALKTIHKANTGELQNVLDNYFLESLFAYNKGDLLHEMLTDEMLHYQSWFFNYCFRHSSLVRHLDRTSRTEIAEIIAARLNKDETEGRFRLAGLYFSLDYIFSFFSN